ncbi:MAG: hypothetical protein JWL95_1948 [Gemmatimonadetes bacterium]|nr:hypothetical protein [Gemmatimonadota bacterium]
MKFTIMIYESAASLAMRTDPDKSHSYHAGFSAYTKALQDAGVVVGGAGLQPPDTATTIQLRDGKRQVQDGPYADTKEQLGGFYVVDVPTLDEALDWAARVPAGPGSVLEVRPNLIMPPA